MFKRLLVLLVLPKCLFSQGEVHGDFQSDFQYYQKDSLRGFESTPEKIGSNNYLNLNYTYDKLSVGARLEGYFPPLLGYDRRYNNSGIPYRFVTYKLDKIEFTAGNFYDQFGNGIVLRSYQNWNIGFDNNIDGFKIKVNPFKGLYLKGLIGKQRFYFDKGTGVVRGADAEFNLNEAISKLENSKFVVNLGASFVSKYQKDDNPLLKLPENVSAASTRMALSYGSLSVNGEYAYKINDPSFSNGNIYRDGQSLFLSATYAQKGFGLNVTAKRIDNMDFRSDRTASGNDLLINFLPPQTPQFTHRLITLYPYATQPNGEMAYQAELTKNLKKKSFLGGKYGGKILVNTSFVGDINRKATNDLRGYESDFWGVGKPIYKSLQIEYSLKTSTKFKNIFTYYYLEFDNNVLRLSDYKGSVYAHVYVWEGIYKLTDHQTMKTEIHYLNTKQDRGDWASILLEYSHNKYFVSLSDDFNRGNANADLRIHYPSVNVGVTKGTTRFSMGYGRQREGVVCVGGLCRFVPAYNGFTATLSGSF